VILVAQRLQMAPLVRIARTCEQFLLQRIYRSNSWTGCLRSPHDVEGNGLCSRVTWWSSPENAPARSASASRYRLRWRDGHNRGDEAAD
jgi:hypothetical protein